MTTFIFNFSYDAIEWCICDHESNSIKEARTIKALASFDKQSFLDVSYVQMSCIESAVTEREDLKIKIKSLFEAHLGTFLKVDNILLRSRTLSLLDSTIAYFFRNIDGSESYKIIIGYYLDNIFSKISVAVAIPK